MKTKILHFVSTPILWGIISIFLAWIFAPLAYSQTTQTFTSSGSFTVPSGVTSITVECWGGGGGGGRSDNANNGRGGGGGGAYARSVLTVTPGAVIPYTVGAGGAGTNLTAAANSGGNTVFGASLVVAVGGGGVANNSNTAGAGGLASASTGTVKFNGGNGVAGSGTTAGAGGGGAGSTAVGGNGSGIVGGTGGATNGGNGGAGRTNGGAGNAGATYGGGGGGGRATIIVIFTTAQNGGAGAGGAIKVTYTLPSCAGPVTAGTVTPSSASGCGGSTVTLTATGVSTEIGVEAMWQYSDNAGPWTDLGTWVTVPITGVLTTTNAPAATRSYRLKTRCTLAANVEAYSNTVVYTVDCWTSPTSYTLSTCSGTFYDSGGSLGAYSNSQNYTVVLTPSTAGQKMRLAFTSFATEDLYDGMMIYDGPNTSSPLISSGLAVGSDATTCPAGSWRGTGSPGTITSTHTSGSITIVFRSDGSNTAAGWAATLSCVPPPPYQVEWTSVNTGTGQWCAGETRNVTVTVKNTGSAAWTSSGANAINFSYWWQTGQNQDSNPRVLPFSNLLPQQSQTITFPVTAPATTGSNTLAFDLVREGCFWFRNNGGPGTGPCFLGGPGNLTFTSSVQTVNPNPAAISINPSTANICLGTDVQTLVASGGAVADVVLNENFNGGSLPTGWNAINNSAGGTPANADWTLRNNGYQYQVGVIIIIPIYETFNSNDNSTFYLSNSDAQTAGTTETILETPTFSLQNYSAPSVQFYHYFRRLDANCFARVEISTNGGGSWTTLQTYNAATVGAGNAFALANISLAAYANQTNLKIRFRYNSNFGWYWAIDNVSVRGTKQSLTWSPSAGLYSDPAASVAYAGQAATTVYAKPATNGVHTFTATSASNAGCVASQTSSITVAPCLVTWTGNVNTNWHLGGNWSSNAVPVAGANVLIPDVSLASGNFPLISTAVTVNDLTIHTNASVNVAPTAGLVIDGTLNASAGTFTLQSDATGTAYLDDFSLSGTVLGNIRVQRFNPLGATGYRQLGTPVSIPNINAVNGFTPTGIAGFVIPVATCDPNYVAYNSPYGSWLQLVENGTPQFNCSQSLFQVLMSGGMTNGRGYYMDVPGNSTLTFTGAPNTGAISFNATSANTPITNGWNMVSNPYPSPLAWGTANVPTGLDAIGKVWVTSGAYTGTFQDLDANIPGTAVAIGQAFQVRVSTPGATVPFAVDNNDRTTSPPTYLFAGGPGMVMNIDIQGNGFADLTKVRFIENATPNMDALFDSPKMLGNANQPMVYSVWNGKNYSTNSFAALDEVYALPLGVKLPTAGSHTLVFSNLDEFPATALIYLEDTQTGTMQDIRANDTYEFTEAVGANETRFILHFYPPVENTIVDATCETAGEITFTEQSPGTWNYAITNTENQTVSQGVLDENETVSNLPAGDYTVTLTESTSGYVATETLTVTGAIPVTAQILSSIQTAEVGQEIDFTANTQNADVWHWDFGDMLTASEQTPTHLYNSAGVYDVTLTASNSDCENVAHFSVNVFTTASVDELADDGIKIWAYENVAIIQFTEQTSGKSVIIVYDINGKKLLQKQLTDASGTIQVDCGNIAAGTYTIELRTNNKTITRKVIMGMK